MSESLKLVRDEYYQDPKTSPWDYPDEPPDDEAHVERLLADVRRPRREKTVTLYRGNRATGEFKYLKPARPVGLVLNETTGDENAKVLGSKEASWHSPLVKQPTRRQFNKTPGAEEFKRDSKRVHGPRLGNSYTLPPF